MFAFAVSSVFTFLFLFFSASHDQAYAVTLPAKDNINGAIDIFARDNSTNYLYIKTGTVAGYPDLPTLPSDFPDSLNVTISSLLYEMENISPDYPFIYCLPKRNNLDPTFYASYYQLIDNMDSYNSFQALMSNDNSKLLEMANYIVGQMIASNAGVVCSNMYNQHGYIGGGSTLR